MIGSYNPLTFPNLCLLLTLGRLVRYSLSTVVNNKGDVKERFIKEMCPALCKDAYIRHNAAVKVQLNQYKTSLK